MKKKEELQKKVDDTYYWDSRVSSLDCNYFGDEVKLVFEDDEIENITYITFLFEECYTIKIKHVADYDKEMPYRELTRGQIPYFMQDVSVDDIIIEGKKLLEFTVNMFPIDLIIICNKFSII